VGPRGFGQVGPRGVLTGGTWGRSDRWDPEGPSRWVFEGSGRWGPCIVDGFSLAITVIIQVIL
jgi:hypothetical protein